MDQQFNTAQLLSQNSTVETPGVPVGPPNTARCNRTAVADPSRDVSSSPTHQYQDCHCQTKQLLCPTHCINPSAACNCLGLDCTEQIHTAAAFPQCTPQTCTGGYQTAMPAMLAHKAVPRCGTTHSMICVTTLWVTVPGTFSMSPCRAAP